MLYIFTEVGGLRLGDILFALFSWIGLFLIVTLIITLIIKMRKREEKEKLDRIESKLDQLLEDKNRGE